MRSLLLVLSICFSAAAFAEQDQPVRQPAKQFDVDSALASALAEQRDDSRESSDRSVTSEEQPKIYIELGDES